MIEEEEAERMRKKKLAEYDFQVQSDKIKRLTYEENEDVFNSRFSQLYLNNKYS